MKYVSFLMNYVQCGSWQQFKLRHKFSLSYRLTLNGQSEMPYPFPGVLTQSVIKPLWGLVAENKALAHPPPPPNICGTTPVKIWKSYSKHICIHMHSNNLAALAYTLIKVCSLRATRVPYSFGFLPWWQFTQISLAEEWFYSWLILRFPISLILFTKVLKLRAKGYYGKQGHFLPIVVKQLEVQNCLLTVPYRETI